VTFKGLPLTTGAPGQLWGSDTVIERLDDAVFDATVPPRRASSSGPCRW